MKQGKLLVRESSKQMNRTIIVYFCWKGMGLCLSRRTKSVQNISTVNGRDHPSALNKATFPSTCTLSRSGFSVSLMPGTPRLAIGTPHLSCLPSRDTANDPSSLEFSFTSEAKVSILARREMPCGESKTSRFWNNNKNMRKKWQIIILVSVVWS